eukprot:TRINITY_DN7315_c0_g1_i1.p1 TRINITY_DN7315_c0_g1~~TRINITY_DN7315_c0_g1_i1.p1  ORF type:complete len:184 (-),score=40.95 TRINITY_DN7315_c0_g1_i1:81-599(-)
MCEIARNSVIQSGFKHERKVKMIGKNYDLPGSQGNDHNKTNVPDCRLAFRHETLQDEVKFVMSTSEAFLTEHERADSPASISYEGCDLQLRRKKTFTLIYVAMEDFNTDNSIDTYLSVQKGDPIDIIDRESDPWKGGDNEGDVGHIPSNILEATFKHGTCATPELESTAISF